MTVTRHAPPGAAPSGAYAPAMEVVWGGLRQLYVSGQGTRDPATGARVLGEMGLQARAAMDNLKNVVEGSGFSMTDIVKVTVYLTDLAESAAVNAVYASYFPAGQYPARSTVGVSALPGGQSIEVDALAVRPAP